MKKLYQKLKTALVALLSLSLLMVNVPVYAQSASIVINEVAWMGTQNSANEEWIELYNNTDQAIDLNGWKIVDDGSTQYVIASGSIPAHGYFLIASTEQIQTVTADAVISLSLANSGDSLELYDSSAILIDAVNSSGGAWYAGDNTNKYTMSRLDPSVSGDLESNWANSQVAGGSPKAANGSEPVGDSTPAEVTMTVPQTDFHLDDDVQVAIKVQDVSNLFAYGFDVKYDPQILDYQGASEGSFLSNDLYSTSFQSDLENAEPGKIIIGNAIVESIQSEIAGVTGSGDLLTLNFKVISGATSQSELTFESGSFLSNRGSEIVSTFSGVNIGILPSDSGNGGSGFAMTSISAEPGEQQYSLQLTWNSVAEAETYQIFRKNQLGDFIKLGETASNFFIDNDDTPEGGKIIPQQIYEYKVVPLANGLEGQAGFVQASESRGIKGDNDRSNRVDGRDLKNLAANFAAQMGSDTEYQALLDSSYDGFIDGSDLIDIGANWATTYEL